MLDFQIPRITSESVEENRGSFVIEPLDRGLGASIARRLLERAGFEIGHIAANLRAADPAAIAAVRPARR